MSVNDVKVIRYPGEVREYKTEDLDNSAESTVLLVGEPVKLDADPGNFPIRLATGDPEVGTDIFLGIVNKEGTEASGSDGVCEVITLLPSTVLRADAHTSTNVNTAAKLLGLIFDYVTFDLTSSAFTVNEDEGTDPNKHGLCIIDGDIDKGTLDFTVHLLVTALAPLVGQTID